MKDAEEAKAFSEKEIIVCWISVLSLKSRFTVDPHLAYFNRSWRLNSLNCAPLEMWPKSRSKRSDIIRVLRCHVTKACCSGGCKESAAHGGNWVGNQQPWMVQIEGLYFVQTRWFLRSEEACWRKRIFMKSVHSMNDWIIKWMQKVSVDGVSWSRLD